MSCCVCKNSTTFFNSKNCKSNHKIHKKCIKDISHYNLTCKECIFLILQKKEKIGEGCILCKEMLGSGGDCKIYKNLCSSCQVQYVVEGHLKQCRLCQLKIRDKLAQCLKCKEFFPKINLYRIPRCELHNYCKPCINRGQADFSDCHNCRFYFNFIPKEHDVKIVVCNLCGKFPEGNSQRCSLDHNYCKLCLKYLNIKLIELFDRIIRCEFCVEMLKEKYGRDSKRGSSIIVIPEAVKDISELPPIRPIEEPLKNIQKIVDDLPDILLNLPSPHQIVPSKLKDKKKASCFYNINEFYLQKRPCDTCASTYGDMFFCGHCHCKICIGTKFLNDLYYILSLIHSRLFDRIPPHFVFHCITPDCRSEVPVPSTLMISLIESKMSSEDLEIFKKFSSYFDGIPMSITSCSCSNLIAILQNGRKIFCTCNP